jgi:hypothetical protein
MAEYKQLLYDTACGVVEFCDEWSNSILFQEPQRGIWYDGCHIYCIYGNTNVLPDVHKPDNQRTQNQVSGSIVSCASSATGPPSRLHTAGLS